MIIAICLVLLLSGCAHDDPWTRRDTVYELTYIIAVAADAYSTTQIQYNENLIERQPITRAVLGANPSTSSTWQYFTSMAITHYLISQALPQEYRRWWQIGGTTYHSYFAFKNCDFGICGRPEEQLEPEPTFCPACQPIR